MKLLWIAVGVICAGIVFAFVPVVTDRTPLPPAHDPQLVGKWNGTRAWLAPQATGEIEFKADGTGEYEVNPPYRRPFNWGTRAGTLYVEYLAVDSTAHEKARYKLEPWGRRVDFTRHRTLAIPDFMKRR